MIRTIKPEDKATLAEWIAADPEHQYVKPEFFFGPGTETLVIEQDGEPVLFYRLSRALRVDIQFQQGKTLATARALAEGCADLKRRAPRAGFKQLLFDSTHAPLMTFCKRRFGFRQSTAEFICDLEG